MFGHGFPNLHCYKNFRLIGIISHYMFAFYWKSLCKSPQNTFLYTSSQKYIHNFSSTGTGTVQRTAN